MKKLINKIDFGETIELKRIEKGLTYEELGAALGYTKSGMRHVILSNNIKCSQVELFSIIMQYDFFGAFSGIMKGTSPEIRNKMKENAQKVRIEEYQEKYIGCLEEKAEITKKLQEATLYINRCEMLLVKNNIPLPNK